MSEYYFINGKVEIYDFEKFRDWLFEELQKQDFVGVFDINIDETNKCICEKCGKTCQENDLYGDTYPNEQLGVRIMKIEFRVWDKNKRKMLYLYPNDTILFKNGKCSVWKENQYDKFEECCCCEVYSNVIPMQYTGMKDKDGNKIYKADILKDTLDNLYIVDFIRGCFYLKTRYEKNGEWLEWLPMSEITQLAEPENFYRIGNIYENPELLA